LVGAKPQTTISVYAHGASGHTRPERTLAVPNSLLYGPAIVRRNIYLAQYSPPALLGYDKDASGSPKPVFTLELSKLVTSVVGIAGGP
jgi:hypothetical protein